jgi:raffinose/stachyose/melibiose transport system substrate-binding protein
MAGPAMAEDTVVHLMFNSGAQNEAVWRSMGDDFEAANPGVKVDINASLENEAYKAKLPTLLQSKDRPDVIYSWAGGVMEDQINAGFIKDISAAKPELQKLVANGPLGAYEVDGKLYGAPLMLSYVGIWYNKELISKAGVDMDAIKSWDDFLGAVKKIKAAGITPLIMGGGDKWPMHFIYSYLIMRLGGPDVLKNAKAGKDGGFTNPVFVEAGKKLKELADLEPFQDGWLGIPYPPSAGLFGDGKGAMIIQGTWVLNAQASNSASGNGLDRDNIGLAGFPMVAGGKGSATDTMGGVQGFLVTADAPDAATKMLEFFETPDQAKKAAEGGVYIPASIGTSKYVKDPLLAQAADRISNAKWHQNFFDQDLGASVGRVINDMSVAIAAGEATPEEAAQAIQDAWDQR